MDYCACSEILALPNSSHAPHQLQMDYIPGMFHNTKKSITFMKGEQKTQMRRARRVTN